MNKLYKNLFFVLSFLLLSLEGFSTHIVGGSLTYEYLGANTYTVKLTMYRDCCPTCAAFPANPVILIRRADGVNYTPASVTLNTISTTPVGAVLPPCATAPGSPPCAEERVYSANVVLPPSVGGLHLHYSVCCRNGTINNITTPGAAGETFYAFIPGSLNQWVEGFVLANGTNSDAGATAWTRTLGSTPPTTATVNAEVFEVTGANAVNRWQEDFTLANGTTVDAGATAWTRTLGATPPTSAQVNTNQFEVIGANNALMTWTSQVINIAAYPEGINLSVDLSEAGAMDVGDNITVSYSLNGGASIIFPVSGFIADDFGAAVASATGISGTTVQIFITTVYDAASPATEIYRFDNVTVSSNASATWTSQVVNIAAYPSVNLSVIASRAGTMEAGDSLQLFYSLNGGPLTLFTTNGQLLGNFATPSTATTTGLTGSTIQIVIRATYNAASPNTEIYRWDMVSIYSPFITNSSPVFGTPPPLYLCAVNPFSINYSATDTDGDSLVYSMMTPYTDVPAPTFPENTANLTSVTWTAGFSATSPFNTGGPGVTLNSVTGIITGSANSLGQYVFGVKCSEYRSGKLISEIVRDYQANVINCPPFVPTTPTAGTSSGSSTICAGQTLNLTASSPDAGVTYSWTGPNGFTSSLQNPSIPAITLLGAGTYSVTATVAGCTSSAGTITITVNPTPIAPTAGSNSPVCANATISLTSNTVAGATYSWTGPSAFTSALEDPTIASATAAMAGTYSLTVTVAGCTSPVATTTVVVNPTPAAPTVGSNSPVCANATINLTSNTVAGATYSWTGPNAFTSALEDPTIATATAAMAGTYSLTVTLAGCTSPIATTVVVVNPTPAAPIAGSNSPVCAGATILLTSNTVAGATYSWTGPAAFTSALEDPTRPVATAAMAGTYSLTVTVAGCTSPIATTVVVVNPTPVAPTAGSNSPVCAGTTINLTSNTVAGATYSWTGPSAFTSALEDPTIAAATAAMAGTYSLTVTVAGCASPVATTTVIVNPIPAAPTAGSNSPVCTGATILLTSNTIAGATYSWTGPAAFASALEDPTRPASTLAMAGTYSVTVTVAGCTSPVATTTVIVNPTPVAPTAGSNSPVCAGTPINLTSNTVAGATYSWTGPSAFTSALEDPTIAPATAAMAGTYSVTVTVAGCTSPVATTTVVVNPIPATPTAGSNSPICVGATLNLTTPAAAGATYSWTGPNSFSSALQNPSIAGATALATGTYSITVTISGCTSAAGTVVVTVNATPAAPTAGSNSPLCVGSTLNLTASSIAGATYSWTGPNSFSSTLQNPSIVGATALAAGTYTVVANNGCASSPATTVVVVNPIPSAPVAGSNSPICLGGTLNLTASAIAGATYSWTGPNSFSSAIQNPSIAGVTLLAAGTYSVTATVNGCTGAAGTVTVIVNTPPSFPPTTGSNSPVCTGTTLNLTATSVAGATFSWTGPNSFSSTLQNPSIASVTLLAAGTYSVTATVPGCATSPVGTVTVVVNATPAAPTAGSNSPVCVGGTLNLTASNIAGATYSWIGPNSFVDTNQNPSIVGVTALAAGTYSVTATVSGCTSVFGTTTVVVNPIPSTPAPGSNSPICVGGTIMLTTTAVAGATYSWTGPNSFSSSLQNPTIPGATVAADGTYTLTITVSGCTSAAGTVVVTINAAPATPTASSNSPVCTGDTLFLSVTTVAGATYSWTGPNAFASSLQNPLIVNPTALAAGTYTVVANNGCATSPATTTVIVNPTPVAPTAGSNSAICEGSNLNLTASTIAGATYSWSGPNSFSSALQNPTISGATALAAGTYSLTVTVNGCISSIATTNVIINIPAISNAGSNQTVCANNAVVTLNGLVSGGSVTGNWTTSGTGTFSPSSTTLNATYTPSNADTTSGSVTLTLTSTNNGACVASVSTITITITDAPIANAGIDQAVCINNADVILNGTVSIASGGIWSTSGDGTFSPSASVLNPTYTPGSADLAGGIITLTLTTTGNGTCLADADQMIITITAAPTANAGPDQILCQSSPNASLNGIITGAPTGIWTTLGSGTFSPSVTTLNATYIPSTADTATGNVTLILTSTNNGGCNPVSDTMLISYTDIPVVFAGANQTVCANNANVSLNGVVSVGSTTGIWTTSGSGTFSPSATTLNATYIPSAADTLAGSVILTLSSTSSCVVITDNLIITITDAPAVNAGAAIFVCANNADANYSATISGGSTTGIWTSSGSGTFSPDNISLTGTYTPSAADTSAGTVYLILTSTGNGTCNAVADTILLTITPPPTVFAGSDASVCANSSLVLSGGIIGGAGTIIWTTSGTGTFSPDAFALNATYTPSTADTTSGSVTLTITSTSNGGCIAATDQVFVTITDAPTVDAGPDQTVCGNNPSTNLSALVNIATGVVWTTLGDGTFFSTTSLNTTYAPGTTDITNTSVTLIASSTGNGTCVAVTDTVVILIGPAPIVNAGANIFICTGTTTANLSGSVSGATTTGIWTTLGTGTFSLDTDLNATYTLSTADTSAGSVMVILTSTNNGTCNPVSDTVSITITTIPTTFAGNDTSACANNSVIALSGSVIGGSGLGQWTTSGSGTFTPSDTTLNASYIPSAADIAAGNFVLTLTPLNSCNPISDSLNITITPAPIVNAGTDTTICGGTLPINLNGTMNTVASGAIWTTNGTGTFSPDNVTLNAIYTPAVSDPDTLIFVLTTTGNGSCNAEFDTMMVFRNVRPTAAFTVSNSCVGQAALFTDTSNPNGGTITSWAWDFGTSTSSLQNPSLVYATTGTYTVSLVVSSGLGCTDSITNTITVNPLPTGAFSYVANCQNDVVAFTSSSSTNVVSWAWNFGDGNTSILTNPTNLFDSAGVYSVVLTVVSDSGCTAISTQLVTINPTPLAGFTAQVNCTSLTVNFTDTSSISSGTIVSYNWSFGDGGTSTLQNPSYTYPDTGSYTVILIVQSNNGCADTASISVTTGTPILADYIPQGGTYNVNQIISFTNQSTGGVSYIWDFGDGSATSSITNPTYSFVNSGTYSVILFATNSSGCSDTASYVFTINSSGYVVPTGFTPDGDGLNDFFYVLGNFTDYELRVFNEWGNQIFMSNEQYNKWDGKYKGFQQPAGTFIYIFNGKLLDGEVLKLEGEINIIR